MNSEKRLRVSLELIRTELLTRYGRQQGCTKHQVDLTLSSLGISEDLRPFAYCAFLEKDNFDGIKKLVEIDWRKIESGVCGALTSKGPFNSDGFHESWSAEGSP